MISRGNNDNAGNERDDDECDRRRDTSLFMAWPLLQSRATRASCSMELSTRHALKNDNNVLMRQGTQGPVHCYTIIHQRP